MQATKQAQKSAEKIKKTQDTYLADFDVVRVAPDQSKSDTDSSEGGIDYSAINGDNVQLPDWAKRMKDAIKSGDWAGRSFRIHQLGRYSEKAEWLCG